MTDPVEAARQGQAVSLRTTWAPAYPKATGLQGMKEVAGAQLAIVAPPAQEEPLPTPATPSPIQQYATAAQCRGGSRAMLSPCSHHKALGLCAEERQMLFCSSQTPHKAQWKSSLLETAEALQ